MAQSGGDRSRKVFDHKIPHRESRTYVATFIDSSYVGSRSDEVGATISVNLTRTEHIAKSEIFKIENDENSYRQVGPNQFDITEARVLEFTALMRPDVALSVASAIFTQLSQLPDRLKLHYRIPQIEVTSTE